MLIMLICVMNRIWNKNWLAHKKASAPLYRPDTTFGTISGQNQNL